jgi:epoxyqueuosine reductase QueG
MEQSPERPTVPLSGDCPPSSEGRYPPGRDDRDAACGFELLDEFERFNQCNDIYSRARWDPEVRSERAFEWFRSMFRPGIGARNVRGYQAKDFALKLGGWTGSNMTIQRNTGKGRTDGYLDEIEPFMPPAAERVPVGSPEEMAADVKRAARFYGADLVGITATDLRWHYSRRFSPQTMGEKPNDLPPGLDHTIVVATAMDAGIVATYPSATASAAVGLGYSIDIAILQSIATFIHALGYRAVPSLNDTAQRIPYAIQAGLGEYSRATLLITKEFGPRVRIGQVFTDLPLAHDEPVRFGVMDFCAVCRRCADACPPRAIPFGGPQETPINRSNAVGIRKWSVDAEKCFDFWTRQGSECGVCIRVCPYNKDTATWRQKLYYRAWVALAATRLRRLALWIDTRLDFGRRDEPASWWRGGSGRRAAGDRGVRSLPVTR